MFTAAVRRPLHCKHRHRGNPPRKRIISSSTSGATVSYTPIFFPSGGAYEVSIWIPGSNQFTATSPAVDVVHQGTTSSFTVSVATTGNYEGGWVQVGTAPFTFDPTVNNSNNRVIIKTSGGGTVPADAVRFTRVGAASTFIDNVDATPNPNPGNWSLTATAPAARPWGNDQWIAMGINASRAPVNTSNSMVYTPSSLPEYGVYDLFAWYPHNNSNEQYNDVDVVEASTAFTRSASIRHCRVDIK